MHWADAIHEALPPPRGGEPADLRRDIVDELDDHLVCAVQRELRRSQDETQAERVALERFGDPRRLARQLYWEAIKERIMRDRIMLIAIVMLAAVSLASSAFAWLALREGRQANQAFMTKLAGWTAPPDAAAARFGGWSKARIRVVSGTPQGPPAAGIGVRLSGVPYDPFAGTRTLEETTNPDGIVEFGPIRPGTYALTTLLSAGLRHTGSVLLYPDRQRELTLVCPPAKPETMIQLRFEPDIGPLDERLQLTCHFVYHPTEGAPVDPPWASMPALELLANLDGGVQHQYAAEGPHPPGAVGGTSLDMPGLEARRRAAFVDQLACLPGRYHLSSLTLYPSTSPFGDASNPPVYFAYPAADRPLFEASPDTITTWHITLPEPILDKLRSLTAATALEQPQPDVGIGARP